eukprot:5243023-Prymnesium_polylepis.1
MLGVGDFMEVRPAAATFASTLRNTVPRALVRHTPARPRVRGFDRETRRGARLPPRCSSRPPSARRSRRRPLEGRSLSRSLFRTR